MKVYIYSLDKKLFEGDAEVATLPATGGEISVLKDHIPLVTPLGKGRIALRKGKDFSEESHVIDIERGVAQINPDSIIVLVH